ncbi:MAG: hypothetical protein Q7K03_04440 [Dehalococcoidia bacterium]|nr:hypothetical protein [Dehalococcoidia bacterium]
MKLLWPKSSKGRLALLGRRVKEAQQEKEGFRDSKASKALSEREGQTGL